MHKTLIMETQQYSKDAIAVYRSLGHVETWERNKSISLKDVTILVVRLGYFLNEQFLGKFPRLEYIVSPTTGLNHIDQNVCRARNIRVISLQGESEFLQSITSTAEHCLGLMLALLRHIPAAHRAVVNEGQWIRDHFASKQVTSLIIGIVGMGRIGCQLLSFLNVLGAAKILVYDPGIPTEKLSTTGAIPKSSLSELFAECDIVSLHADYQAENYHLIDGTVLSSAKRGMLLVNSARGELIDEEAVVKALIDGHLGGVAVDVLEGEHHEGHLGRSPLVEYAKEHSNIIITPHVAGCTRDAMRRTEEFVAQRLIQAVDEH